MSFPSEEQRAVITHRGRPLVVVAGPGTGKTRTLVERMIKLLSEDSTRAVSFVTFTRTSQRDTRRKIEDVLGPSALEESVVEFPRTSTLHTYAKSLVHRYATRLGRNPNFSVLIEDKGEKALLLDELISDLGLQLDIEEVRKGISCLRSTNSWPDDFPASPSDRIQIMRHFEALLLFYNTFDIEGLVISACKILADFADVLPPLYLQVDEYQDLNPNDQQLVQLAASHLRSQVVVVGDDAQSIYGFRFANYRGMRELWDSPEWEHVPFPDCHRLPCHVQNAAQALIANEDYLGGRLNPRQDNGRRIRTLQCTNSSVQMSAVGKYILHLKSSGQNQEGQPLSYKDFMVLCPASNFVDSLATTLQSKFAIPTKQRVIASIPSDYWRLLLVLRMLHSEDSLALRQWLSISGLSDEEVTDIRRKAMQNADSLYSYCARRTTPRIHEIYDALARLRDTNDDFENFRRSLEDFPNLSIQEEVLSVVGLTIDEATQRPPNIGSVIRLIYEKFGLTEKESESDVSEEDKVLVTTLHSAKGLESEYVFITWMNSKYMPMSQRDVCEEQRVLYVALTRAKQDVILTFHEIFDPDNRRLLREETMSPFLREIRNHLDVRRVTAEDVR